MSEIHLARLAEPFPAEDIEWRVSRAGMNSNGIYCLCFAYITARGVQERLDKVCGPGNWKNERLAVHELRTGVVAMETGISIKIDGEWISKFDVSEPTAERGSVSAPAKGGFSGAMKRAGAQWGIGRYLYYLDETFAEVSLSQVKGWTYATLSKDQGGATYYWKQPSLPAWALPKEPEHAVSQDELNGLKRAWKDRFAQSNNPAELRDGFTRFVLSIVGEFPVSDHACWTRDALEKCRAKIAATTETIGVSSDVPFEE